MSKLIAGASAAYAGGNAQTAINTAETAVQNNALVPMASKQSNLVLLGYSQKHLI
jgi:hypothetical protein